MLRPGMGMDRMRVEPTDRRRMMTEPTVSPVTPQGRGPTAGGMLQPQVAAPQFDYQALLRAAKMGDPRALAILQRMAGPGMGGGELGSAAGGMGGPPMGGGMGGGWPGGGMGGNPGRGPSGGPGPMRATSHPAMEYLLGMSRGR